MVKLLAVVLVAMSLVGCSGLTSFDVAKNLSAERTNRYTQSVEAHSAAVKSVMTSLSTMDRGGMKIETTEDGRIKAISYTDKLDMGVIAKALEVPQYKEERVQSILSEAGDFVLKATNLAVPFASIYYGSKNHIATQEANVLMNSSNNQAQSNMINAYTGNFNKETTVNTSDVSTSTASNTDSTSISTTSTTSTQTVPDMAVDVNSTTIGGSL